jgi:hypothetical protein
MSDDSMSWTAAPAPANDWSSGRAVVLREDSITTAWLTPDEAERLSIELARAAKSARSRCDGSDDGTE